MFDLMATEGEEAWTNIDARLAAVPAALDGYRATLSEAADDGHVAARRQLAPVAEQVRGWTGQDGRRRLLPRRWSPQPTSTGLRGGPRAGTPARPATRSPSSAACWRRTRPAGPRQGRRRPRALRASAPATSSAPPSTSRRPTPGAGRSSSASRTTWRGSPAGSSPAARSTTRSPPSRPTRRGTIARHGELPRLDAGPRRPDPRRHGRHALRHPRAGPAHRVLHRARPTTAASTTPARARTSPAPAGCGGRCPTGIDSFATWREVTTVFHEGVPGHHLQVAQTAYRKDMLNRWQRLMCWVSGHGEGWALYAERLMDELGYLDDPGDKLGMLDGQGFRAARVDRRHRHAPGAGDPAGQPVRVPPRRDLDARARPGVHAPALPHGGRVHHSSR